MTTPNMTIVKIPLAKPANKFIVLKTTWSTTPFQLDIMQLDEDYPTIVRADEYTGTLSMQSIEAVATGLDASVDDVFNENKSALATDGGSPNFSYELESNQFQWYKNGILPMVYGTVKLMLTHSIGIDLLLTSLQIQSEYKISYERVCGELAATQRHHERTKEVYDRCITDQVGKEEQTLTKFLALLNEKKAKIGRLENLLYRVRGDDDAAMDAYDGYQNRDCDGSEKQPNEPSTSEVVTTNQPKLPKRKRFNRNETESTVSVCVAASQIRQVQEATNSMLSTSGTATAAAEQKPTEKINNLSQDPIYSNDTEELCADM